MPSHVGNFHLQVTGRETGQLRAEIWRDLKPVMFRSKAIDTGLLIVGTYFCVNHTAKRKTYSPLPVPEPGLVIGIRQNPMIATVTPLSSCTAF